MVLACDLGTQEIGAGRSQDQNQPGLPSKTLSPKQNKTKSFGNVNSHSD